ncbi:hypothetical protein ACFRCW_18805 [Streptomyces sp. NPDC056653]
MTLRAPQGVLALAPKAGLGVSDPERRAGFGEENIAPLLRFG